MAAADFDRATSYEGVNVPTAVLAGAELFDGLEPHELVDAAAAMRYRTFEAGAVICREGEPGESMFIVVEGLVHLLAALEVEPEARSRSIFDEGRLIGKLRPGDAVGTGSLLTGDPRSATAKAAVATDALELGRDEFRGLMAGSPRVLENLTRILTRRLSEVAHRRAGAPRRGEAVALIAPAPLSDLAAEAALRAGVADPAGAVTLDWSSRGTDALLELDARLHDAGTVIVRGELGMDGLEALLSQVDRTVALAGEQTEVDQLADLALGGGVKGQPIELATAGGVDPPSGDALRPVRVLAGPTDADAGWLGRHLSRTKLGLALGAGGAKGYAHIGALEVLEEAGYTIDFVSGASIGAIIGTWLALGLGAGEIETRLRQTFTPEVAEETLKIGMGGATGYEKMVELLREVASSHTFDDCTIPLSVLAADLTARRAAVLREGPLADALIAATALAGVFPPYEMAGHRLVDGLAIDPVPTAAVIEDGADVTVAINLIGRDTLDAWPGQDPPEPDPARRGMRMLDTLLEVMDLAQLDTGERGAARADVAVTPLFGPGSWRDFELADLFLAAGRQAMEQQLDELRAFAVPQSENPAQKRS